MKKPTRLSTALLGLLGLAVGACTTTYTEDDVRREELQAEDAAHREEGIDREIGEGGGENEESIRRREGAIDPGEGP
jgi:hypothetical protein